MKMWSLMLAILWFAIYFAILRWIPYCVLSSHPGWSERISKNALFIVSVIGLFILSALPVSWYLEKVDFDMRNKAGCFPIMLVLAFVVISLFIALWDGRV